MEKRSVKIAIIGTGSFAEEHARIFKKMPHVFLSGVFGKEDKRREQFAKKFGIRSYSSLEECLNDEEVQFVDIVCKHAEHADYGLKAAAAGKCIIMDKPIDIDIEKARKLFEMCEEKELPIHVISQFRYHGALKKIKVAIEKGVFGRIYAMNLSMNWHRSQEYYDASGGWRKRWDEAGGGVLMTQAIHWIDVLLWLGDDVESVYCCTNTINHQMEVEDSAAGIIKFKNGILATIQASTSACFRQPDRFEVHGTKGSCTVENTRIVQWNFGQNNKLNRLLSKAVSFSYSLYPMGEGSIENQLSDIIAGKIRSNAKEALRTLDVILKLYKSANKT